MRALLAALLCLAAVSCSQPEPLAGADLPPASLPDEFEPELWTVTFSHDFDPGWWSPGHHTYRLHLDCPEAGTEPVTTDQIAFTANEAGSPLDGDVYLRLVGLSTSLTGPRNIINLSVDQPTSAAITLLGLDAESAEATQACSGSIEFDGQRAELTPSAPVRP
jgi:hypothetical protein